MQFFDCYVPYILSINIVHTHGIAKSTCLYALSEISISQFNRSKATLLKAIFPLLTLFIHTIKTLILASNAKSTATPQ